MSEQPQGGHEQLPPGIRIEERNEKTLTPEDLEQFSALAKRTGAQLLQEMDKDITLESSYAENVDVAFWNALHVNRELQHAQRPGHNLNIVFAFNETNEIVGYSYLRLRPEETDPDLRATDAVLGTDVRYLRQGIGTNLIRARHASLARIGVPSYTTVARDVVLDMYSRLGVTYEPIPRPAAPTGNSPIGKLVRVHVPGVQ